MLLARLVFSGKYEPFSVPELWRISCAIQGRTLDALVVWQGIANVSFHWVKPCFDFLWECDLQTCIFWIPQRWSGFSWGICYICQSETCSNCFTSCYSMLFMCNISNLNTILSCVQIGYIFLIFNVLGNKFCIGVRILFSCGVAYQTETIFWGNSLIWSPTKKG